MTEYSNRGPYTEHDVLNPTTRKKMEASKKAVRGAYKKAGEAGCLGKPYIFIGFPYLLARYYLPRLVELLAKHQL